MFEYDKLLGTFKYKMTIVLGVFSLGFYLVSCSGVGEVDESGLKKTDKSGPPGAPSGLSVQKNTGLPTSAIDISWTAPSHPGTNIDGSEASISKYVVEWSTNDGFPEGSTESIESVTTNTNVTDLTAETQYYVRVKAVNSAGLEGDFSGFVSVTTDGVNQSADPGVPSGLSLATYTASPTSGISVSWTAPTDLGKDSDGNDATISKYVVEWSTDISFPGGSTESGGSATVSTNITGLTAGTQYYVRVKAVNSADLTGPVSATENIYTLSAPSVPTGLSVQKNTGSPTSAIDVSWTAPSDAGKSKDGTAATISKYVVEWSTDSNFPVGSSTKSGDSATVSTNITGLTAGTQYYVRVKAVNSADLTGPVSATENIYTLTTLGVPTGLSLATYTVSPTSGISVSWTAPTDLGKDSDGNDATISKYVVEWSTDSNFPVGSTESGDSAIVSTNITGLTAGTQYYVRVKAVNSAGATGPVSAAENIYTLSAPSAPTMSLATYTASPTSGISVSWTAPTDLGKDSDGNDATISKYVVEWSTDNSFSAGSTESGDSATVSTNITGLTAGTQYYVRVKAVNSADLTGPVSATENIYTLTTLGVPTGLSLATYTVSPTSGISVSWTAPTDLGKDSDGNDATISKYVVEWSTDNSFPAGSTESGDSATVSTNITGLTAGTQYYVRVKAVNSADLTGPVSATENIYTLTTLGVPTGLSLATYTVSPTSGISVSWTAPDPGKEADGTPATISKYVVEWSTDNSFPVGSSTKSGDSATVSTNITGLTAGTQYYVRVKAVNSADLTGPVSAVENIYTLSAPSAPTVSLATYTASPTNGISVSWTAPDPGKEKDGSATISKYVVEWSTDISFPAGSSTKSGDSATVSTNITGLTAGTQYYVRVKAVNSADLTGPVSATENIYTLTTLGVPTGLSLDTYTASPTNGISVSWIAPTDLGKDSEGNDAGSITKYMVEWSTDSNFPVGSSTKSGDSEAVSTNITGLTAGTQYYVRVKAVNSAGATGPVSAAENIYTLSAPSAPGLLVLTINATDVTLGWTVPSDLGIKKDGGNATLASYVIEYKEKGTSGDYSQLTTATTPVSLESAVTTATTTVKVVGLSEDKNYYFRMKAVNSESVEGHYSTVYKSILVDIQDFFNTDGKTPSTAGQEGVTVTLGNRVNLKHSFTTPDWPIDEQASTGQGDAHVWFTDESKDAVMIDYVFSESVNIKKINLVGRSSWGIRASAIRFKATFDDNTTAESGAGTGLKNVNWSNVKQLQMIADKDLKSGYTSGVGKNIQFNYFTADIYFNE